MYAAPALFLHFCSCPAMVKASQDQSPNAWLSEWYERMCEMPKAVLQMGLGQDSERKKVFNQIGASGHISNSLALIASMRTSPGPLGKSADPR